MRSVLALRVMPLLLLGSSALGAQPTRFRVEETTIAAVHAAFRARSLTCRSLVQQYLDRIAAYDKRSITPLTCFLLSPSFSSATFSINCDLLSIGSS